MLTSLVIGSTKPSVGPFIDVVVYLSIYVHDPSSSPLIYYLTLHQASSFTSRCDAFGAGDRGSGSILGVMNVFNKHSGSMDLMKV